MKIIILGGTGYIGSALHLYLKDYCAVDTMDLEWFGNYTNPSNIQLDFKHLTKEFLAKYDSVILLAAHSSVQMCKDNNVPCFNNNVRNFVNLLPKLTKEQIFIYASSSSVYGNIKVDNATEDVNIFIPDNAYDLSKAEIDNHAKISNVNYYGLRFGTVNGASYNFRADIMINAMVTAAINEAAISISSPHIRRPILAINDLCRAIKMILFKHNPVLCGIYNLASFNESVGHIGNMVAGLLNVELITQAGSSNYDFTINTSKFCNNFNFTFQGRIDSIVNDIMHHFKNMHIGKRNTPMCYE